MLSRQVLKRRASHPGSENPSTVLIQFPSPFKLVMNNALPLFKRRINLPGEPVEQIEQRLKDSSDLPIAYNGSHDGQLHESTFRTPPTNIRQETSLTISMSPVLRLTDFVEGYRAYP